MINSWVGLLAWLPAQAGLLNGFCGCLGSLARLLGWQDGSYAQLLGRAEKLFPCPDRVVERAPKARMALCAGTQIRKNCPLNSKTNWGHCLGSADGQRSLLGRSCLQECSPPRAENWLLSAPPVFFVLSDPLWSSPEESDQVNTGKKSLGASAQKFVKINI